MSPWLPWTDEVFAVAKAEGRPLLAATGAQPPESLGAVGEIISRLFVAVLVDAETRPDAALRIGRECAVVLDSEGFRRAVLPLPACDVGAALERLAGEASSGVQGRPEPEEPAWTGAVCVKPAIASSALSLTEAFEAVRAAGEAESPPVAVLQALLYASSERGDLKAGNLLAGALNRLQENLPGKVGQRACGPEGSSPLLSHACLARLFWDAHALTGDAQWRETAVLSSTFLLRDLYDPGMGAFRRAKGSSESPAVGNARAVLALLRAAAFGVPGASEASGKTLAFLQNRLYDPSRGLVRSSNAAGGQRFGLLADSAWVALAFAEASSATGLKAHREFADVLMKSLFQELWERESGGFLDRVPLEGDPPILRELHLDAGLNAVAFEACWRLHHLKGNANYRRWLDWGLRGVWPVAGLDPSGLAGLARAADMAARGRLALELVGRVGDPRAGALLSAALRHSSPRAVISFVDPDDQDYILAHKLTAGSYPRLFGCGADLRRLADTDDPARVGDVIAAVRASEGV